MEAVLKCCMQSVPRKECQPTKTRETSVYHFMMTIRSLVLEERGGRGVRAFQLRIQHWRVLCDSLLNFFDARRHGELRLLLVRPYVSAAELIARSVNLAAFVVACIFAMRAEFGELGYKPSCDNQ